jgi:hypothetical protein
MKMEPELEIGLEIGLEIELRESLWDPRPHREEGDHGLSNIVFSSDCLLLFQHPSFLKIESESESESEIEVVG